MAAWVLGFLLIPTAPAQELDLAGAVVFAPGGRVAEVLREEVDRRTGVLWKTVTKLNGEPLAVAAGTTGELLRAGIQVTTPPAKPESFSAGVTRSGGRTIVWTAGHDARGALFGAGYLLRQLRMSRGKVLLPGGFTASDSPRMALRGHQIGYRPKNNTYDAWTPSMMDQHIRDLAIFGANAIELIPPRSDDDADSPHFPIPQLRMMQEMSRIIDSYGLDCWVWYPAQDEDYAKPETVEFALKEWGDVFRTLPRVDAIMVPGGDPGHTAPKVLMPMLEKQAANLRQYHPRAQVWIAPQGFSPEWIRDFLELLRSEPEWLTGVVFAPWMQISLEDLRKAVPARYPIRHYPDITHTLNAQYPLPDWDTAWALTSGREPVNPRPRAQAHVLKLTSPSTIGFITYSEGCNDDVNKFVWSGLGWNPDRAVEDVLREYSRYFVGPAGEARFTDAVLGLEENWRGPARSNAAVERTLELAQAMERNATPQMLLNWRFQQVLYRSYYDAYVKRRLIHEEAAEKKALEALKGARAAGPAAAMAAAERVLDEAAGNPPAQELRVRIHALAEAMYQSARLQSSVRLYKTAYPMRSATLDSLDAPLNNRLWLKSNFARIRGLQKGQAEELEALAHWTDPGPGGFYDDLGDPSRQPHLVPGPGFATDPGNRKTPLSGFWTRGDEPNWRLSWVNHAETLFGTPLEMEYKGLDPHASYSVRIVYGGDAYRAASKRIKLVANGRFTIHEFRQRDIPAAPVEFAIPRDATSGGSLRLSWTAPVGGEEAIRGAEVSEVWLIRRKP